VSAIKKSQKIFLFSIYRKNIFFILINVEIWKFF
jgi:hypothetical protein